MFRGRTKAKDSWIDNYITVDGKNKNLFFRDGNDYARQCFEYIHQNSVKANLTERAVDWEYSSAIDYAGLRKGTLCNYAMAKEILFK